MLAACAGFALFGWLIVLLLPWGPWRNGEVLERAFRISDLESRNEHGKTRRESDIPDLSDVTVVIPARDEAALIGETLEALAAQAALDARPDSSGLRLDEEINGYTQIPGAPLGGGLAVILVDDCSSDGTSEAARTIPGLALTVVRGTPKPADWAGKVWALEQGLHHVRTRYTLMLDADIRLAPGVISKLLRIAQGRARDNTQRQLVSVMATLPMSSFWEKLLCPAFIYFFKLLYPFALANSRDRRFGSAAGGCILLEMKVLKAIGGLESIRGELIDDCALARRVKRAGFRTWTGQSRLVESRRRYAGLGEIWDMVARSAYTQLRCSPLILILTSLVMLALFWGPPLGLLAADPATRLAGMGAWTLMALTYLPTLIFYGLSPLWALSLPLVGGLYLGMTWTSALRYARGVRSQWKGREYGRM